MSCNSGGGVTSDFWTGSDKRQTTVGVRPCNARTLVFVVKFFCESSRFLFPLNKQPRHPPKKQKTKPKQTSPCHLHLFLHRFQPLTRHSHVNSAFMVSPLHTKPPAVRTRTPPPHGCPQTVICDPISTHAQQNVNSVFSSHEVVGNGRLQCQIGPATIFLFIQFIFDQALTVEKCVLSKCQRKSFKQMLLKWECPRQSVPT